MKMYFSPKFSEQGEYRTMRRPKFIPLLLITIFTAGLFSGYRGECANAFVPAMDLTSRIDIDGRIQTRGDFDLSFDGGYKYQAKLLFSYYNLDIEGAAPQALLFKGAQASIHEIFNLIDFTYWTGFYGIFGEGRHYSGHLYHLSPGFEYNGFYPVYGTGLGFGIGTLQTYRGRLLVYQREGRNTINSFDLTFGLVREAVTFGLFGGLSDKEYRLGTQVIISGQEIEFSFVIGNPSIVPGRPIDFDDFYLLAEEWFKLKNFNLILSAFTRPAKHYNYLNGIYEDTGETNDVDFNLDLNFSPEQKRYAIGGELNVQTNTLETLGVFFSPYIQVNASGVAWKIKLDINALSDSREIVTALINIQSAF
jgi:hypothetical protein